MVETIPTGIDVLDRKLNGGIPPGSLVVLSARPASQSELFLSELTSSRQTLYLSTERSEAAVRDSLLRSNGIVENVAVRALSVETPIEDAYRHVQGLPERVNIVIDTMGTLERESYPRLHNFLNALKAHAAKTESIAFLHCLDGRYVSPLRDLTEHVADVIFELSTELSRDTIENRLTVPKFRGGSAPNDSIKLELTEQVAIDISRDIA